MAQSLAQCTAMKSVSRTAGVRPFTNSSKPVPILQRHMVVRASKVESGEDKGPNPMLMKVVSAAAAVQLALLPIAGTAAADISDILPETAKSGSARAELNQRTSDLPTFQDVGDSLRKNLGVGGDPKNIGKAIDRNTPDIDLTKNPKDVAQDVGRAVDRATPDLPSPGDLGRAVDRNTPDLPNANKLGNQAKDAVSGGSGNPFESLKNAITGNADLPSLGDVGRAVDRNTPDLPSANKLGDKAQDAVSGGSGNPLDSLKNALTGSSSPDLPSPGDVGRAVDRNTPDLPSANKLGDKAQDAVSGGSGNPLNSLKNAFTGSSRPDLPSLGDVGRAVDRNTPDLPSPGDLARKVDRNTPDVPSPGEVGRKAQDAVSGGPGGLPNPFEALKSAFGGGNAPNLPDPREAASKVTGQVPDLKGAAKDVKGKMDQATPNLGKGLRLPGSDVDTSISTKPL